MTDQHLTALATVVQDVLLLVSAGLIGWYLLETRRLRIAAQQQVESQSLPAIVVQEEPPDGLKLLNIGNGPALGIEWRFKDRNTMPAFSESGAPAGAFSYLEARQGRSAFLKQTWLVTRELHCLYRSVSGRRYVSVSRFMEKDTFETYFHPEQ